MSHIVIVINYNNYQDSITCTNTLLNHSKVDKVIIVDNCSHNDSVDILKSTFSNKGKVDVIKTNANLGYAKAIDFGYKYIKDNYKFDFIHVSNSDIVVDQEDFFDQVEKTYLEQEFFILGPNVITNGVPTSPIGYFQDEKDFPKEMKKLNFLANALICFSYLTFDSFENVLEGKRNAKISQDVTNRLNQGEAIVPILSGCYLVFSKKHTDFFDYLLNPITFLYNEEMLITYMLLKNGIRDIVYNPQLEVHHYHGGSSKGASRTKARLIKDNYKLFKKEVF